ncbi:hypothetical protein EIN_082260 [Entamoeba invadens IP1]|uniref:hypothetical protein n=1 Tax=Entamoeba invadens IP1 TaxID=370355 RepID=UPI0002C3D036|nr:hypothetical protein EIN_082260 [Entamoeba invadens IP1]ELP85164.1 hypothetical protein EIN_082260 [Entamoeba invadens IP1]|eukprot:XP_004184510.1 hypothetical protein EIN_082260 [Entamoeba invadens IP1]
MNKTIMLSPPRPKLYPLSIPLSTSIKKTLDLNRIEVNQEKVISLVVRCDYSNVSVSFAQVGDNTGCCKVCTSRRLVFQQPGEKTADIKITPVYSTVDAVVQIQITLSPHATRESLIKETSSDIISIRYTTSVSNWVDKKTVTLLDKIGEGKEGQIYRARKNGEIVAVKRVVASGLDGQKENEMYACLKNDYIVKYFCSFKDTSLGIETINIVMELAPFGCLMSKYKEISESVLVKICLDISKALKYLHVEMNIIHRDVKPQNILLFNWTDIDTLNAKLTDFGISRMINSIGQYTQNIGTLNFTAPEVNRNEKYSYPCDIYSFGMTMYFTFTKIDPYDESISKVLTHGDSIPRHPLFAEGIWQLVNSCCAFDQNMRINITQCVSKLETLLEICEKQQEPTTIDFEQKEVYFSTGQEFDLEKAIHDVVLSFKDMRVDNEFIKALLMLHFGTDIEGALKMLQDEKIGIANKGDKEYVIGKFYINNKNTDKGLEHIVKAAEMNQPEAIMYIVTQLLAIDSGEVLVVDKTKEEDKAFDELMGTVIEITNTTPPEVHKQTQSTAKTVSMENAVKMIIGLSEIFPECRFYAGLAMLHGFGVKKNIKEANRLFLRLVNSGMEKANYCEVLCHLTPHNTMQQHIKTYDALSRILYNVAEPKTLDERQMKSDVKNNQGVFLFKGWGEVLDKGKAFKCFKKAAELGNVKGQYNMAYCLLNGFGCATNKARAVDILQKILKQSHLVNAQLLLANCYFKGEGVARDMAQAVNLYVKAACLRNSNAMNNLGSCFFSGNGVKKNANLAFRLFEVGTKFGNSKAQVNLALCYLKGVGVVRSLQNALNSYEESAKGGNIEAQLQYAKLLLDQFEETKREEYVTKAIQNLELASKGGNADAMYNLGLCYYKGKGSFKQCALKAFDLFKAAASKKQSDALYILGVMYFKGENVCEDKQLSFDYITKASELHNHRALYYLGMCYLSGIGKAIDPKKALELFAEARRYGSNQAALKIAWIFLHGAEGIPADKTKAFAIYKELADSEIPEALYMQGECYMNGDGVRASTWLAKECYVKASKKGHVQASQRITFLDHDIY